MAYKKINKFVRQTSGNYCKYVEINDILYKIIVNEENWNKFSLKINDAIKHWKKMLLKGKNDYIFKYGKITEIDKTDDMDEIVKCLVCDICGKKYKHKSSYDYHRGVCNKKHKEVVTDETIYTQPINERIYNTTNNISNNNTTNNTTNNNTINNTIIHNTIINMPRDFGNENTRWFTERLMRELRKHDDPTCKEIVSRLVKEKHFNDDIPENQNIRISNYSDIPGTLEIVKNGLWNIQTIYEVCEDVMEELSEDIGMLKYPTPNRDLVVDECSINKERGFNPKILKLNITCPNIFEDKDEYIRLLEDKQKLMKTKEYIESMLRVIQIYTQNKEYKDKQKQLREEHKLKQNTVENSVDGND